MRFECLCFDVAVQKNYNTTNDQFYANRPHIGQRKIVLSCKYCTISNHCCIWGRHLARLFPGTPGYCYLIALGSGKALRFMRQLSGNGTISEQRIFSGSLLYGTPHTW